MSKLIKDTLSGLFKVGSFVAKQKYLKKDVGARFSTEDEVKQIFSGRNKGVLIDGDSYRLSATDSFEHIAVIAKPGSGKTTAYIIPNILELAKSNCSMVVNDPSKEVFELTTGHLERCGFNIIKLSPDELETSSRFNPFDKLDANDTIEIEQVCASIIMSKYGTDKEQIWNDGAISILEILAKCLAYSQPQNLNLIKLNSLIQNFGADGKGLDDWVAENSINPVYPKDNSLVESWIGLTSTNEKMLSSYITICKTALKQLNNLQIKELLNSDTVNLNGFRKQKTVIYLNFPEAQQAYYQFIIDVFYSRLFSVLMKRKVSSNDLDVYCFLDEFGNAHINNFNITINNIRKYKVSLSIVLQGISQLDDKYGEQKAKAIKSGIGSSLIYKGGDLDTTLEYAKIIGKRVIVQRNNFMDVVKQFSEMELLASDQLRTMADNQAMFISKNRHPIIIEYHNFFNNRKFSKLTSLSPTVGKQSVTLDFDTKLRF